MTAADVVGHFPGAKRGRDGWMARCPAHEDRRDSLSITAKPDRTLLHCHAGCAPEAVAGAAGLSLADLFVRAPSSSDAGRPSIAETYDYTDESGTLLYQVVRYLPKDFRQRRPDGNGGWIWKLDDVPRVPYRLPQLVKGVQSRRLVPIVEGEKDVHSLATLGVFATCNAGGAGKWSADLSEHFRDARVVILPDNDEAGHRHAVDVASKLHGIAAEVRIVELPGLPPKGDVSDWINTGGTADQLKELVRAAPTWSPETAHHSAALQGPQAVAVGSAELAPWPEPRDIPSGLSPVEPFDPRLLPDSLRAWIEDVSDRIQCPPDFPGAAAMVALASVVGRRALIRPQQRDDWTVTPNLWGAVIGRPGVLKSPAVSEAMKPLRRLEVEAAREYDQKVRNAMAMHNAMVEVKRASDKDYIKQERKKGRTPEEIARELASTDAEVGTPPRRRYLVNDATPEALAVILADNPDGTLVFRDELVGLLRSLEKEGREDARAFYLEAWNGDGRFESNRIGRGSTIVENCTLSIFGNIQPGPLRDYLRNASDGGRGADGLVQRFQLAVWPDVAGEWKNVDRWRDTEARDRAFATFERLAKLDGASVGGERDRFDPDAPPFLRFDAAAQERFTDWRKELERRVRSGDEHPALESHLAKYRSLIPTLALVSHLADGFTGPVGETSLIRALAWAQYLETHTRRMYGAVTGADSAGARGLAKRLQDRELSDGFTIREIYRNCWSDLATKDDAEAAVELLEALDWIRAEMVATGGKPKTVYRINPRLEMER